MKSIAHIRESDREIQSVEQHLIETQNLAEAYGDHAGLKHLCGLSALLHDAGKFNPEFKEYILQAVNNPENPPKRGSVDHATAGGRMIYNLFHQNMDEPYKLLLAEIVGNAIISHHSYLHDYLSPDQKEPFNQRIQEKELHYFEQVCELFYQNVMNKNSLISYADKATNELQEVLQDEPHENYPKIIHYITKLVFSTIIDADRTNTRQFEANVTEPSIDTHALMNLYYDRLMSTIDSFKSNLHSNHPINQLRSAMSDQAASWAEKPSGIYTLSIPTGGGKTLASLRYALKHASKYKKRRIIYIVPFTTIIEQNAKEVRDILEDHDHILEHHSNVTEDDVEDQEHLDGFTSRKEKLRLAKDNWDTPIIFTTMVQFLNVFYKKGNRNTRRLHNMTDAVLIFDEVQKVPTKCISLFNESLNFLKRIGHSSIVLCTATQPALHFVEKHLQVSQNHEMIRNLPEVESAFKRTNLIDHTDDGPMNTESTGQFILQKSEAEQSILVILNTKTAVKKLYLYLQEKDFEGSLYHLSTSMCAAHRQEILSEIRNKLELGEPVICVTTQLIEAGVDVDFDCVIRSLSGLDSIAQAAGRCNRHGRKSIKDVHIIESAEESLSKLPEIEHGKAISRRLLRTQNSVNKTLTQSVMTRYFKEFYQEQAPHLDYPVPKENSSITELLFADQGGEMSRAFCSKTGRPPGTFLVGSYKTAAHYFNVIPQMTTSVLVPYSDRGKELIADLTDEANIEDLSAFLKEAQHYSINLFSQDQKSLESEGGILYAFDGLVMVLKEPFYSNELGLDLGGDGMQENPIF